MRDIRDDLRQRVVLLRAERDQLQLALKAKLDELDAYEAQLSSLLELEEKRAQAAAFSAPPVFAGPHGTVAPDVSSPPPPATTLELNEPDGVVDATDDEFEAEILRILADGEPWAHFSIKAQMIAAGWSLEKGSLGRALQGQLLSMKQRGRVEYLGGSNWRSLCVAQAA